MAARAVAAKSHAPITIDEFYTSFERLLALWRGRSRHIKPQSIGISVSGGADSMALAYLCKELSSKRFIPDLAITPFIVDHKARKESTEEAHKVAHWLTELGYEPRILTLEWPQGSIPSILKDFESQARRLRYQALGKACKSIGIPTLCMGHHQNDVVESVLIRLAGGHRGMGLQGMQGVAQIPECQGIYGVCGSNTRVSPDISPSHSDHEALETKKGGPLKPRFWWELLPMEIAPSGIFLFRPFLEYPKYRLISTCKHNKVPFVSDPTNFDPTLTPRNTVRHLLANKLLPRALQTPSILSLTNKTVYFTEQLMKSVDKFLGTVRIRKLDIRTGALIVQFPRPDQLPQKYSPRDRMVQVIALRRLLDLVSPLPASTASLHKLQIPILKILPLADRGEEDRAAVASQDVFTVGGVMFQPVAIRHKSSSATPNRIDNSSLRRRKEDHFDNPNNLNIWLLTREPFPGRAPSNSVEYDLDIPEPLAAGVSTDFSEWCLWDNRYWIRVRATRIPAAYIGQSGDCANQTIPLVVRSLEEKDITRTHTVLQHYSNYKHRKHNNAIEENNNSQYKALTRPEEFKVMLRRHAPGNIRFTIPVIAEAGVNGRILGFPSFGKRVPIHIALKHGESLSHWQLEWEVQYKRIDRDIQNPPDGRFKWKT